MIPRGIRYRRYRTGGHVKRFNQGGYLVGASHEQGGIPAIVGGQTPIELEGGEYIMNAQTVAALGTNFMDKINSTQTTYHQGGYQAGQLPSPSQFKYGGSVNEHSFPSHNKIRNKVANYKRRSGRIRINKSPQVMYENHKKVCPEGSFYNPEGFCV